VEKPVEHQVEVVFQIIIFAVEAVIRWIVQVVISAATAAVLLPARPTAAVLVSVKTSVKPSPLLPVKPNVLPEQNSAAAITSKSAQIPVRGA